MGSPSFVERDEEDDKQAEDNGNDGRREDEKKLFPFSLQIPVVQRADDDGENSHDQKEFEKGNGMRRCFKKISGNVDIPEFRSSERKMP